MLIWNELYSNSSYGMYSIFLLLLISVCPGPPEALQNSVGTGCWGLHCSSFTSRGLPVHIWEVPRKSSASSTGEVCSLWIQVLIPFTAFAIAEYRAHVFLFFLIDPNLYLLSIYDFVHRMCFGWTHFSSLHLSDYHGSAPESYSFSPSQLPGPDKWTLQPCEFITRVQEWDWVIMGKVIIKISGCFENY